MLFSHNRGVGPGASGQQGLITNELYTAIDTENDVHRFVRETRECVSISELSETILKPPIEKIIISAVKAVDGEKE